MTDCPNAEMRDRLPDLLHERLDESTRAAVMAHVEGCEDCREELELLRGVRKAMLASAPRVNLSEIVYALPKPPVAGAAPIGRRAPRVDWRLAAAVTLLVAGASSLTLLSKDKTHISNPVDTSTVAVAPVVDSTANTQGTTKAPVTNETSKTIVALPQPSVTETVATATDAADVVDAGTTARLSGLNARQLKSLLSDIDQMQAVPVSDPEPVAIKVEPRSNPSGPEGM